MTPDQVKAASEALLQQERARQSDVSERLARDSRLRTSQQRAAIFGVIGMIVGALLGYFVFPKVLPATIIGFGIGTVVGRWVVGRQA